MPEQLVHLKKENFNDHIEEILELLKSKHTTSNSYEIMWLDYGNKPYRITPYSKHKPETECPLSTIYIVSEYIEQPQRPTSRPKFFIRTIEGKDGRNEIVFELLSDQFIKKWDEQHNRNNRFFNNIVRLKPVSKDSKELFDARTEDARKNAYFRFLIRRSNLTDDQIKLFQNAMFDFFKISRVLENQNGTSAYSVELLKHIVERFSDRTPIQKIA